MNSYITVDFTMQLKCNNTKTQPIDLDEREVENVNKGG